MKMISFVLREESTDARREELLRELKAWPGVRLVCSGTAVKGSLDSYKVLLLLNNQADSAELCARLRALAEVALVPEPCEFEFDPSLL